MNLAGIISVIQIISSKFKAAYFEISPIYEQQSSSFIYSGVI